MNDSEVLTSWRKDRMDGWRVLEWVTANFRLKGTEYRHRKSSLNGKPNSMKIIIIILRLSIMCDISSNKNNHHQ